MKYSVRKHVSGFVLAMLVISGCLSDFPLIPAGTAYAEDVRQYINLNDEEHKTVDITKKGTYVLSGSLNGQIRIDAGKDSVVTLILDGTEISNKKDAAIYCKKAKRLVITASGGTENSVSVTGTFDEDDGKNKDAAVFSKADVVLNGGGSLSITSERGHGITTKGCIGISSGELDITSGKKGIQAKETVDISGGYLVLVSGSEGIEARKTCISGGEISITSGDDGINATDRNREKPDPFSKMSPEKTGDVGIEVSGGRLVIDSGGDGVDSNGYFAVSGGEIYISSVESSADGAIDYDTYASISGGTVIAAGDSFWAKSFGNDSAQASILYVFDRTYDAGTPVVLKDGEGKVLASCVPPKSFNSLAVSAPGLESSGTFRLEAGDDGYAIEMNGACWSNRSDSGPIPDGKLLPVSGII